MPCQKPCFQTLICPCSGVAVGVKPCDQVRVHVSQDVPQLQIKVLKEEEEEEEEERKKEDKLTSNIFSFMKTHHNQNKTKLQIKTKKETL